LRVIGYDGLVVPTPKLPLESIRIASVPPVAMETVFVPYTIPVSVSVPVTAGAAAEPLTLVTPVSPLITTAICYSLLPYVTPPAGGGGGGTTALAAGAGAAGRCIVTVFAGV